MRSIIFRAKRISDGKWVYGDLEVRRLDGRVFIHSYSEDRKYYTQYEVVPDTIGQYTGLNDVDGREIYEGDIIEGKKPVVKHLVYYKEDEARYAAAIGGYKLNSCAIFQGWISHYDKVVIGNIHDNPELLSEYKYGTDERL